MEKINGKAASLLSQPKVRRPVSRQSSHVPRENVSMRTETLTSRQLDCFAGLQ